MLTHSFSCKTASTLTAEASNMPINITEATSSTSVENSELATTTTQKATSTTSKLTDSTTIQRHLGVDDRPTTSTGTELITSTIMPETSKPSKALSYSENAWYPTICNYRRCERPFTWITRTTNRDRERFSGYHE